MTTYQANKLSRLRATLLKGGHCAVCGKEDDLEVSIKHEAILCGDCDPQRARAEMEAMKERERVAPKN